MSSPQLAHHLVNEVQQALTSYTTLFPETDREFLSALVHAVVASVDPRDLRHTPSAVLVPQMERMLATIRTRKPGEIRLAFRREDGDEMALETCMEDQPFLVSTMRAFLASEHLHELGFLNAVVKMRRDAAGNVLEIGRGRPESVIRIELDSERAVPDGVEERLRHRLQLVQAMVRDFSAMKERLGMAADAYEAAGHNIGGERGEAYREVEGLLRWLCDENFVFLSLEEYDASGKPPVLLGTSRIRPQQRDVDSLAASGRGEGRLVRYQRSSEESPVHRAGKPGHFIVTHLDSTGNPIGTCVIEGLFTYKALHTPPEEIPFIRSALRELLANRDLAVDGHRGKSLTNAFNSLPLEYLLSETREHIWELTDRLLRAEAEGGSDVHIRISEGGRFAFVFVALPRWQFSEELRQQVQDLLLAQLGGTYADYGVYIDRYDNAIIHYYVTGARPVRVVDTELLRKEVLALAKGWNERLREALSQLVSGDEVEELFALYENAFSEQHKRRASVERLKNDIACLERLRAGADLDCDLFVSEFGDYPGSLNLRTFSRERLSLSRQLPVITNFGFEVIEQYSREVRLTHAGMIDLDNFRLDVRPERIGWILARREEILNAVRLVFARRIGDDPLNQLVVTTTMQAHAVEILRAYVAYLHQLGSPFATELLRSVLIENPTVTQSILAWFTARFEPSLANDEVARFADETLDAELRKITDYTADRVLRTVAEVVRATVRTNAYARTNEAQALAFKVASAKISFVRPPVPFHEIWVYHREFEGVHMRGGKVARGGIRFSDRPDDFRTEIHGLMATQMVKNVLIVPVGAKGGFVLRQPPADRNELRAAGDRCYQVFIRGLLSVTDNVVGGDVVTPTNVTRIDGPDPYLVVAADKGTAHLSDTANGISQELHFWLDDAFASGGSNGYDHKATGITARGAWEATKRSFRELGVDPEINVITAAGVGDMSGDVFGNGLLRSKTIKLLAAFNHAHIFIDPDPDAAASFTERLRLFELPRSQWSDYDPKLLSRGGGVFPRKSKEVPLSPEARTLLGFSADQVVNGDQVIRAILRSSVDLMWMGGIGTYVKSKTETHAEVGDKANDSARIDAHELRCKVFAEGANLAITDRARVELARRGGHNYSSFLDNSAGVDLSDHEVNIKILFAPLLASNTVSRELRNSLLERCEHEVCSMVLANNRSQSRMVSYDVRRSRSDLYRYSRTLRYLVREIQLDSDAFAIPSDDELASRAARGQGLHKCEAAVLCAHAKMLVYRQLLEGKPFSDEVLDRMVRTYFPGQVLTAAGSAVGDHLLRREIATTMVVNRIVDNAGGSFFAEVMSGTGRQALDVAQAYLRVVEAGDCDVLLADLYALEDERRQEAVYVGMGWIQSALEEATYCLLDNRVAFHVDAVTSETRALLDTVDSVLTPTQRELLTARIHTLEETGLPTDIAPRIARLQYLTFAVDAMRLAEEIERSPSEALRLRIEVAAEMNFGKLQRALSAMVFHAPWDGPAARSLGRQLDFHVHKMAQLVGPEGIADMIRRYGLEPVKQQAAEHLEGTLTVAGLVMLDDHLRRLLPPLVSVAAMPR